MPNLGLKYVCTLPAPAFQMPLPDRTTQSHSQGECGVLQESRDGKARHDGFFSRTSLSVSGSSLDRGYVLQNAPFSEVLGCDEN
jgi:hypothetical protein